MTSQAQPDNPTTDDLERLTDLLTESYTASYGRSSLKVRRRYRKLLVALEAARQQHAQVASRRLSARDPAATRPLSPG